MSMNFNSHFSKDLENMIRLKVSSVVRKAPILTALRTLTAFA